MDRRTSVLSRGLRRVAGRWRRRLIRALPPHPAIDREIVRWEFRKNVGRDPDLKNATRFTDKIQRRKLFDRNPLLPILQDKWRARDYVARRVGASYLVPCLDAADRPEAIDLGALPERYVAKANHGCGWNLFVGPEAPADPAAVRRTMAAWLKANFYRRHREWAYRDIPPVVMIEERIRDIVGGPFPADYKFLCFDGVPRHLHVFRNRGTPEFCAGRFLIDGRRLVPIDYVVVQGGGRTVPLDSRNLDRRRIDEMIDVARELCRGIDHIRVDLYDTGERILFGEMTLYHSSGFLVYEPDEIDHRIGAWWNQTY